MNEQNPAQPQLAYRTIDSTSFQSLFWINLGCHIVFVVTYLLTGDNFWFVDKVWILVLIALWLTGLIGEIIFLSNNKKSKNPERSRPMIITSWILLVVDILIPISMVAMIILLLMVLASSGI